jgi:RNA polymerase sigma-70 factor (ECF subfamily)
MTLSTPETSAVREPAPTAGLEGAGGAREAEGALIEALRRGEEQAYEELVRRHTGRMLAVARRLLRNEEDARDAVQQAFVSAFCAMAEFKGGSRLSTWLHRIVVNTALMKLRARARRPEESVDDLLPQFLEDGHHVTQFSAWRLPADASVLQGEVRAQVRAAVDRLPESYRTVVLLRDIEELDTEETARLLGVTPNAVKIRLHRGRQALARLLDPVFRADRRRPTPVRAARPASYRSSAR